MYQKNLEDVAEIGKWIAQQRFLPQDLAEDFIHTFLTGCKGDVNVTKEVLSNYFYARQSIPEIFTHRDPLLTENVAGWKASCFIPLPGIQNDCLVFLGSLTRPDAYSFVRFARLMFMCYDLMIKDNQWKIGDRMIIFHYRDLQYRHLAGYTMYLTRKVAECQQDKYLPGKLKAIHNLEIPPFLHKYNSLLNPPQASDENVIVYNHHGFESLHRFIDPALLPTELEGKAGSLRELSDQWYQHLIQNRNFFLAEEQKRTQESRSTIGQYKRLLNPVISLT